MATTSGNLGEGVLPNHKQARLGSDVPRSESLGVGHHLYETPHVKAQHTLPEQPDEQLHHAGWQDKSLHPQPRGCVAIGIDSSQHALQGQSV